MRATASSPAKTILFGEHFVVKGAAGVAAAIGLRARVSVEEHNGEGIVVESGFGRARIDHGGESWARPFSKVLEWLGSIGYSLTPVRARIDSGIPPGAGLGSSAATIAAFTLAYTALHGDPLPPEGLIRAAMVGESVAHGRPSGIDPTVTVLGGVVSFSREEEPLVIRPPGVDRVALVIADTGIARSTRRAVESVLALAERYWDVFSKLYYAADTLSRRAVKMLSRGDYEGVGELMNINHGLLSAIGVSRIELEELVYKARGLGALGAKITGAGMGGSIVALARRDDVDRIVDGLRGTARWVKAVDIGVNGVMLEE
ncbi:MAG: mevalonate kinase [Desulfurococcales archaeon]|nr:mevalonate kinase [Desulfurococcales archaeon]